MYAAKIIVSREGKQKQKKPFNYPDHLIYIPVILN